MNAQAFTLEPPNPPRARAATVVIVRSSSLAGLERISRSRPSAVIICPVYHRFARAGVVLELVSHDALLLCALLGRRGAVLSVSEAVDLLYGGRSDGGPDNATAAIKQRLFTLRPAAAILGVRLDFIMGRFISAQDVIDCRAAA